MILGNWDLNKDDVYVTVVPWSIRITQILTSFPTLPADKTQRLLFPPGFIMRMISRTYLTDSILVVTLAGMFSYIRSVCSITSNEQFQNFILSFQKQQLQNIILTCQ